MTVFQITPHFILPHSQMGTNKLITHPLIIKNRRLFNNRVKSLLALRFLDTQVSETWLKRLLTPNMATAKKVFLNLIVIMQHSKNPTVNYKLGPLLKSTISQFIVWTA